MAVDIEVVLDKPTMPLGSHQTLELLAWRFAASFAVYNGQIIWIWIIYNELRCIAENWPRVSEEAALSGTDRNLFWGRLFLNPYAFTALEGSADALRALADELRNSTHA